MVTLLDAWTNGQRRFAGLSTDVKPTRNVNNGDLFIEMDTGARYLYSTSDATWYVFYKGNS